MELLPGLGYFCKWEFALVQKPHKTFPILGGGFDEESMGGKGHRHPHLDFINFF